jgi:hypothetical protein
MWQSYFPIVKSFMCFEWIFAFLAQSEHNKASLMLYMLTQKKEAIIRGSWEQS